MLRLVLKHLANSCTPILFTEAIVRVGLMQRFTVRWNLLFFAKEKK